jgi:hypothetical protein
MYLYGSNEGEIMVKIIWADQVREVNCSEEELAEAMEMDNVIMFGCWLGVVEDEGHAAGMEWAAEYDKILREG